jgi:hypothetical protein
MVTDEPLQRRTSPEISRVVSYLMEHPLGEIRTALAGLPIDDRRSATSLAIVLLLLDLPDVPRATVLSMLRTVYFQQQIR